jgi:hypothetical protein
VSADRITLADIDSLTGGRIGRYDTLCPLCGPLRRSLVNRRRKVFRIWRVEPGYATFVCARCEARGYARDRDAPCLDPGEFARTRREADERDRQLTERRLGTARYLWARRLPVGGSVAERYLREARGYRGVIPATIGFLPARGDHHAGLIGALGLPDEPEPGKLAILDDEVMGVHITKLNRDGGKAGTDADKITVGHCMGNPLVVAPSNDGLGLCIAEGLEDALSVHAATGLGAWAAASASRMPALADKVPRHVEAVTVVADDDAAGWRNANELRERLLRRGGFEVRVINPDVVR